MKQSVIFVAIVCGLIQISSGFRGGFLEYIGLGAGNSNDTKLEEVSAADKSTISLTTTPYPWTKHMSSTYNWRKHTKNVTDADEVDNEEEQTTSKMTRTTDKSTFRTSTTAKHAIAKKAANTQEPDNSDNTHEPDSSANTHEPDFSASTPAEHTHEPDFTSTPAGQTYKNDTTSGNHTLPGSSSAVSTTSQQILVLFITLFGSLHFL